MRRSRTGLRGDFEGVWDFRAYFWEKKSWVRSQYPVYCDLYLVEAEGEVNRGLCSQSSQSYSHAIFKMADSQD